RAQPQAYQQQLQSQASSPPPSPESTIYPPWHYGAPQPSDYPSARRIDPTKPQPQGQSAVGQTPARPPSAPTTPSPAAMLANLPQPSEQLPKPSGALANTPGPLPFMAPSTPTPTTSQRDTDGGGRFKKVRELGSGGFGKVWLAVDQNLDRTVAVKFAHAPDTETEQRMLREGRALAAVRHPNCVRIYDIVSEPDGLGIVMEYIEGPSLSQQVRGKGRLDDVAAARLWSTMAGALDAAHAKGVLHRDVKPSNVLIDPEGAPHLIDFGIARSKGDSTLTATGMMMGTPDFLAPETATGKPATPASDAWQLAATVSFALAGQPPRGTRDDVMSALMAAANGAELTELPTDSAHYGLLRAALHTDPTHRPTLDAIREHLGQWLAATGHAEEGPVTAAVAPSESTTKSNIKRS
ncbi:MAG: serine/threonine protein kinase, partial [Sciscionella sp.]|nr:serine/threonine protein kinase [Sciscionella sp.]